MKKWENDIILGDSPRELREKADKLGKEGWEVTTILFDSGDLLRACGYAAWIKREIPEPPPADKTVFTGRA